MTSDASPNGADVIRPVSSSRRSQGSIVLLLSATIVCFVTVFVAGEAEWEHRGDVELEHPSTSKPTGPVNVTSLSQVAAATLLASQTATEPDPQEAQPKPPAQNAADADDDRYRQLLVGHWQRQFFGKRQLEVRAEGTATMVIEPDQVWSVLFGERIRIEIEWQVGGGRIMYRTVRGEPADKYELAKKMWGGDWNERIEALDDRRLLLLDKDGQTTYEWIRDGFDEQRSD